MSQKKSVLMHFESKIKNRMSYGLKLIDTWNDCDIWDKQGRRQTGTYIICQLSIYIRTWTYDTHGQKHSRLSHLRSKFSLFLPISCSLLHPPDALAINPVEQPSAVVIGELNCLRSKDITHFFTYAHLPFLTCKPYSQINFVDLDAEVEVGLAPYETDKFKA